MARQIKSIDRDVGDRLRMRRMMLRISQQKLAAELGVSFQQIQKYENGKNRIAASRLQKLAEVLGVSVLFFFEDSPEKNVNGAAPSGSQTSPIVANTEGLNLIKAYNSIQDGVVREALGILVEHLARPPRGDKTA